MRFAGCPESARIELTRRVPQQEPIDLHLSEVMRKPFEAATESPNDVLVARRYGFGPLACGQVEKRLEVKARLF